MNCSMIDIDLDNVQDCLLLDTGGLKAIETISGEVKWHVHSHEEKKTISGLRFPILFPDCNNDKVNELISIYQDKSFLLICGKTGKALTNIPVSFCSSIQNLKARDDNLMFTCVNEDDRAIRRIAFSDIKKKYHNSSYILQPLRIEKINIENGFTMGNRRLVINNTGICPECHATIDLYENNLKSKTWPYSNAYVMTPKPFRFKATKSNILLFKGHISGFILKVWQWSNYKPSKPPKHKAKRHSFFKNDTFAINVISERVVLITFNETNMHIINASLTEIYQLCTTSKGKYVCQPDLKNQQNSILVADLDQDNSQELISYSSTYVKAGEDNLKEWYLTSTIKVIRLEAELPKLYEEK